VSVTSVAGEDEASTAGAGIKEIARHLLDERLDELTAKAVARVRADEPAYGRSRVSQDDLSRYMRRTLALALIRILGDPVPEELETATSEVGRLRAEQGLALSALLHSYRIDLRILWEAVIGEARSRGHASDEAFLDQCLLLWEAVEANTAEVVDAYRHAREDRARHADVLRSRAFAKLVQDGDSDPAAVREAAHRLSLAPEAAYLVVVSDVTTVSSETLVSTSERLRAHGLHSHLGWVGDQVVGVVALGHRRPEDVVALVEPLGQHPCGAAVVENLTSVPRGARLANAVVRAVREPGVHLLASSWAAALVSANEELASALAQHVLGPLLRLPDHERAAVFETLEAFTSGSGSVAEVASLTRRHRNTVRNRLQAVERATGLSLTRPKDIATLTLAMEWRRGPHGAQTGS
jgi:DNA-binding PucR family transcriptional regulator